MLDRYRTTATLPGAESIELPEFRENEDGGLALDVFDPEPPDLNQPLFADERVIVTPHAGFLSQESVDELRRRTAQQVANVLTGRMPEHVVNTETCDHLAVDDSP